MRQKIVVLGSEAAVCLDVSRTRLCEHGLQSASRNGPNAKQIHKSSFSSKKEDMVLQYYVLAYRLI
jgi:hypothetical protein